MRLLKQTGKGKGDAVRLGFAEARGDVVAILDSDMGVAPEDLDRVRGRARAGQGRVPERLAPRLPDGGTRHALPEPAREQVRSRCCSRGCWASRCATRCAARRSLYRADYERIAANRAYFGDFDPFGDFDLLFGAARLNLRIVDLPIRYHERHYGETNISRFSHGLAAARA